MSKKPDRVLEELKKVYRFSEGTMTMGAFLATKKLTRKTTYIRRYGRKRVHLCYPKLANPVTERTVWWETPDGQEAGMDVGKALYDYLSLPETVNDQEATWDNYMRR